MGPLNLRSPLRASAGLLLLASVAVAGCNGSSDRKIATAGDNSAPAAGAPAAGAPAAGAPGAGDTPSTPSVPAKPQDPACGAVFTFQLLNYSIGLQDPKDMGDKKADAVKAIDDSAKQAESAVADLSSSIKVTHDIIVARLDGKNPPTPGAGEPSAEDASKKIGDWQKDHC